MLVYNGALDGAKNLLVTKPIQRLNIIANFTTTNASAYPIDNPQAAVNAILGGLYLRVRKIGGSGSGTDIIPMSKCSHLASIANFTSGMFDGNLPSAGADAGNSYQFKFDVVLGPTSINLSNTKYLQLAFESSLAADFLTACNLTVYGIETGSVSDVYYQYRPQTVPAGTTTRSFVPEGAFRVGFPVVSGVDMFISYDGMNPTTVAYNRDELVSRGHLESDLAAMFTGGDDSSFSFIPGQYPVVCFNVKEKVFAGSVQPSIKNIVVNLAAGSAPFTEGYTFYFLDKMAF